MVIAKSTLPEVLERIMDGEDVGTWFKGENVHPQLKREILLLVLLSRGKFLWMKDAVLLF